MSAYTDVLLIIRNTTKKYGLTEEQAAELLTDLIGVLGWEVFNVDSTKLNARALEVKEARMHLFENKAVKRSS
jgi:hypothetical protein